MIKQHIILLTILIILFSCSGKKSSEQESITTNKNEIELNVQVKSSEAPQEVNHSEQPAPPPVNPPVQENPPPENRFFFSGRTELLSLPSSAYISPEGFSIGDVFVEKRSSVMEREIVETGRLFFTSFNSEKMLQYIEPSSREDIIDYCEYFFYGKITISDYIFGKPRIMENDSQIEIVLLPDFITLFLYLSNRDGKWLINGLEADLRSGEKENEIGEWAPAINPLRMGNY